MSQFDFINYQFGRHNYLWFSQRNFNIPQIKEKINVGKKGAAILILKYLKSQRTKKKRSIFN